MACTKHDNCKATRSGILAWLRAHLEEHRDPRTDEINCTKLAEAAAHHFDHEEWLDDPNSNIWDLCLTAATPP